jgi:uncharacterized protein YkwD
MRRRNITACALVALATFGAGTAEAAHPSRQMTRSVRSLLTAINAARAAAGVSPLSASSSLGSAANWQSQQLARAGIINHVSPDGSTLLDRLTRVRWHGTEAGEDLAVAPNPAGAVAMWMQSPGHRQNLLSASFHSIGLGMAWGSWRGRNALYVTADFGS